MAEERARGQCPAGAAAPGPRRSDRERRIWVGRSPWFSVAEITRDAGRIMPTSTQILDEAGGHRGTAAARGSGHDRRRQRSSPIRGSSDAAVSKIFPNLVEVAVIERAPARRHLQPGSRGRGERRWRRRRHQVDLTASRSSESRSRIAGYRRRRHGSRRPGWHRVLRQRSTPNT